MTARWWAWSAKESIVAGSIAVVVAIGAVLLYGAPPLVICWMGVGPAPQPQTSECERKFFEAASPFVRLQYNQPLLADLLIGLVAFVAAFVVVGAIAVIRRRAIAR